MTKKISLPRGVSHLQLGIIPELIADALSEDSEEIHEWIRYQEILRQWKELIETKVTKGELVPLNRSTLMQQRNVQGDALEQSVITKESFVRMLRDCGFEIQTITKISKNLIDLDVPKPEPRQLNQEKRILAVIKSLELDAQKLPYYCNGKVGVKSEIRLHQSLSDMSKEIFKKAWLRLSKQGLIAYKNNS